MSNTERQVAGPKNTEKRNQLIEGNLGLVYHVAKRMARSSAGDTPLDDIVSAGTLGLMRAAEGFDPSLGTAFSTYAASCIRGAILDERRRCDAVPRSTRAKARQLRTSEETLMRTLGRRPNDEEVAHHVDLDVTTVWEWRADVNRATTVSLDQPASHEDAGVALRDLLVDERSEDADPLATLQREEQVVLLREAILKLKPQQRTVLSLYYYEGLTLGQIGEVIEVTESRVSQIRTAALAALRAVCGGTRGTMV
jgi:RNA polymerase sigma factor FliA